MSTTDGGPKGLRPSKELSLPPEVEGPIKGETLLHISGLKLADGPLESQTLQVGPRPCALSSSSAEFISIMQNAARCRLFHHHIQRCCERLHMQYLLPAMMRRGCLAADSDAVVGRPRGGDAAAAQQRRWDHCCALPSPLQRWVNAPHSHCAFNSGLEYEGMQVHVRVLKESMLYAQSMSDANDRGIRFV